jgi:SAM-dependent methyltransferase
MLKTLIETFMRHPLARNQDLDSPETTVQRAQIIANKLFLKRFYQDCYERIVERLPSDSCGLVVELGAGAGFLKEYIPGLVTSEILQVPNVDIRLDGRFLPFKKSSLRAIVMVDVFHHIPSVGAFLSDSAFCVKPGGAVIMVEPWITPWSRFVYEHFHHEPLDPESKKWELSGKGPLSNANSALPWIVFERDRAKLEEEFREWSVAEIDLHAPISYLLSGGLSFRSFIPGACYGLCRKLENVLRPGNSRWAMFATIVLRRMPQ